MGEDSVRTEDSLEQAVSSAVEVGRRHNLVALAKKRKHRGGGRKAGGEGERSLSPLKGGQARFQRGSGRVAAP